jgi:putative sigma-54 modulation protein
MNYLENANMKSKIQTLHFDAESTLIEFVQSRIDKLGKYYKRVENCTVTLSKIKNSRNKNSLVEIALEIPGHNLFSKDQSENFELAADNAFEEIKKQLIRHKELISGNF